MNLIFLIEIQYDLFDFINTPKGVFLGEVSLNENIVNEIRVRRSPTATFELVFLNNNLFLDRNAGGTQFRKESENFIN